MTGSQTRQKFLDYFAERGHRVVRSSSLVPANDPTLLFTNAGMNQFKDVFLGQEKRDYVRATTSQKCVRAGGKHNDLDNVGYTRRHHTFFEMLGNFSFGDYFKRDAIAFAWELITGVYEIPKDKLYVTVFREDDDAERLWQEVAGVPKDRIFRCGEKDNFWQMGDTGPCGPCSEIHYDYGVEAAEPGREHEQFPDDGGGRFVEIWNLVFMQFDRDLSGKLTPLPKPSIDTGMGLERIAAILQGKLSNYDTDLIRPIIDRAGELFGKSYSESDDEEEQRRINVALRINADHARATAFLINDGVMPSNEGRGYVLRKIMRRAMRNARRYLTSEGYPKPYLFELTGFVAEHMRDAYPEMMESVTRVATIVKDEEHRYATTFLIGEGMFHAEAKGETSGIWPGDKAFHFYETYGVAPAEQADMAHEYGLQFDWNGFEAKKNEERARARASWKGADKAQVNPIYQAMPRTEFVGRETLEAPATVTAVLIKEPRPSGSRQSNPTRQGGDSQLAIPSRPTRQDGDSGGDSGAEIALDRTPFYAEAGGQVGDTGVLLSPETGETLAIVESAYVAAPGKTAHKVKIVSPIKEGDTVIARVDPTSRQSTMRNHTGTHLLHAALRTVLGTHVKQAGSVVEPSRLRFDFTHYAALDAYELSEVERLMNQEILANREVHTDVMDLDRALETGAMALFGEKYGDQVRVVSIDSFSKELCGGTHVARTGDIGICKIVYEGSISAGVRRIEAITGEGALRRFQEDESKLGQIASGIKASTTDIVEQVSKVLDEKKHLEHENQQLKIEVAQSKVSELEGKARVINGVNVVAARVDGLDRQQLRTIVDSLRNKWKTAVVVLASAKEFDISIVSGVSKDLTSKVQAGKLVQEVALSTGGKGGGRPDMAEGGGKDTAALAGALDRVYESVREKL
jgi:alanyl-tRNA synthetase